MSPPYRPRRAPFDTAQGGCLLLEDGTPLLLEDDSGCLLLEDTPQQVEFYRPAQAPAAAGYRPQQAQEP